MQQGLHAIDTRRGARLPRRHRLPRQVTWTAAGILLVAAAGTALSVLGSITGTPPAHASLQFRTRQPLARATVLSGSAEDIAARIAAMLFAAAPAAVVADGSKPD